MTIPSRAIPFHPISAPDHLISCIPVYLPDFMTLDHLVSIDDIFQDLVQSMTYVITSTSTHITAYVYPLSYPNARRH